MRGGCVRILLVEDNPSDVYFISMTLATGDIPKEVAVAKDGEEAFCFLQKQGKFRAVPDPELIILDLNLPKRDGHQVLAFIKSNPALRRIPVLILSSAEQNWDVLTSYELGANCYLQKPRDLDDYFDLVRQIEDYWLTHVQLC